MKQNSNFFFGAMGDYLSDPERRNRIYSFFPQGEILIPNEYRDSFIELTKTSGKNVEMYDQLFTLEGHEWNYPERGKESFKLMRKTLSKSDNSYWAPVMDVWDSRSQTQKMFILNAMSEKFDVDERIQMHSGKFNGPFSENVFFNLKFNPSFYNMLATAEDQDLYRNLLKRLTAYHLYLNPDINLNSAFQKAKDTIFDDKAVAYNDVTGIYYSSERKLLQTYNLDADDMIDGSYRMIHDKIGNATIDQLNIVDENGVQIYRFQNPEVKTEILTSLLEKDGNIKATPYPIDGGQALILKNYSVGPQGITIGYLARNGKIVTASNDEWIGYAGGNHVDIFLKDTYQEFLWRDAQKHNLQGVLKDMEKQYIDIRGDSAKENLDPKKFWTFSLFRVFEEPGKLEIDYGLRELTPWALDNLDNKEILEKFRKLLEKRQSTNNFIEQDRFRERLNLPLHGYPVSIENSLLLYPWNNYFSMMPGAGMN